MEMSGALNRGHIKYVMGRALNVNISNDNYRGGMLNYRCQRSDSGLERDAHIKVICIPTSSSFFICSSLIDVLVDVLVILLRETCKQLVPYGEVVDTKGGRLGCRAAEPV